MGRDGRGDAGDSGKADDASQGVQDFSEHRRTIIETCLIPYDKALKYRNVDRRPAAALRTERTLFECLSSANDAVLSQLDGAATKLGVTDETKAVTQAVETYRDAMRGESGDDAPIGGLCEHLVDASDSALGGDSDRAAKERNVATTYRCRARAELHMADLIDAHAHGTLNARPYEVVANPSAWLERCDQGAGIEELRACIVDSIHDALPELAAKIGEAFPGRDGAKVETEVTDAVSDVDEVSVALCRLLAPQGAPVGTAADAVGTTGESPAMTGTSGDPPTGTTGDVEDDTTTGDASATTGESSMTSGSDTGAIDGSGSSESTDGMPEETPELEEDEDVQRCLLDASSQLTDMVRWTAPGTSLD